MGHKHHSKGNEGRVVTHRAGERWTVELQLDEWSHGEVTQHQIDVVGTFSNEAAAMHAAQGALDEWRAGRVTLRDLLLRELAAAYRHLREKQKLMKPAVVPTTRATWEQAIGLWELGGWLDETNAARYRDHVRRAFASEAARVKRHRLVETPEPDVAG